MAYGIIPPSNLPPQQTRWGRWVEDEVSGLTNSMTRFAADSARHNGELNATLNQLAVQIKALPVTLSDSAIQTGFGITGTHASYASVQFQVPTGKNRATVTALINGAVLDTTSGGTTVAYGRINFGGVYSNEFSASKDAGASQVNNIINGTTTYNVNVISDAYYSLHFELRGLNATAFPARAGNFAQITIIATFTTIETG